MRRQPASRAALELALGRYGLRLRGGLLPEPADTLPVLPAGVSPAVVWMVGQVGSECWDAFVASTFCRDGLADPMDRWSQSIGDALALQHGGVALYPSDGPPFYPFQQWARRAEPQLQASPLMLQIHPVFGLWHAYRFALVLPDLSAIDAHALQPVALPAPDMCLRCDGQPCLSACPVDAFSGAGFAVDRCADHLRKAEGRDCMQGGCLARRACPLGVDQRYSAEHAAFHMKAFASRH